jgi:hypothetical protein
MSQPESKYIKGGRFDICAMVNDDFVLAIRKVWNETHYTSCLKLLVSFIDTMAFVDTGDSTSATFKAWVGTYVDLAPVGITSTELWEHRNALLHMTTYDSRKVASGTVRRIVPYIGNGPKLPRISNQDCEYYNMRDLLMAVMTGTGIYLSKLNQDDAMRRRFCDNYTKTASDSNMSAIQLL